MAAESKKFKCRGSESTVYTIHALEKDPVRVTWTNSSGEHREHYHNQSEVVENFKMGDWYYINTESNTQEAEHTGGSVNYYKVHVANPTTLPEAYDAEANDIIESLGLTFAEGNLFKAIWRMAADRNGKKKKGNNSVYDAEKLVFFAERVLVQEKAKHESK